MYRTASWVPMVSTIERFHCVQDSQLGPNGVPYREVPLYCTKMEEAGSGSKNGVSQTSAGAPSPLTCKQCTRLPLSTLALNSSSPPFEPPACLESSPPCKQTGRPRLWDVHHGSQISQQTLANWKHQSRPTLSPRLGRQLCSPLLEDQLVSWQAPANVK